MNKHNITAANYQKEFVMTLAKSGEAILHSLVPDTGHPEFEWDQEYLTSTCEKLHILHMAMGIAGEGIEFFEVCDLQEKAEGSAIEELGDTLFYAVGLAAVFDMNWEVHFQPFPQNDECGSFSYIYATNQVLEQTKKYFIYADNSRKQKIQEALVEVLREISDACIGFNVTLDQVIDYNVEKLSKRYLNFIYSDKAAQVRADKMGDTELAEGSIQEDNTGGDNPPVINSDMPTA